MKIGITGGKPQDGSFYPMLKSAGFECFDFNMACTEIPPYTLKGAMFDDFCKEEKKIANAAGMTIWQVHGPMRWPVCDGTPEEREERMEKMKRSIRATALLGAKYWVIHPLMPHGLFERATDKAKETREMNLAFWGELLKVAKDEGVTMCLENMPFLDFSISSPAEIASVVREMNDPAFAMCLDTGHANMSPDWETPADAIRKYGDLIKTLHIHDNRGKNDNHMLPFTGTIDWKDFGHAITECAWEGVLSMECAPNGNLPADILADMYAVYSKTVRAFFR